MGEKILTLEQNGKYIDVYLEVDYDYSYRTVCIKKKKFWKLLSPADNYHLLNHGCLGLEVYCDEEDKIYKISKK